MLAKKEIIATSLFVSIIFIPLWCRKRKKIEIIAYYNRKFAVVILHYYFLEILDFVCKLYVIKLYDNYNVRK